ncbi:putative glycolipid-binding domain-containing protein [Pontibacillus yanchengensis]|uniref:putative glycolipid-binding domain-containing protein n=1 Tax=Pontibacillus yanchengensis TaxID=462910 RepID=UPI00136FA239|nr:putative glycolipid-binding domain-containing protein [Pontibacillus yanchengensis]
MKKKVFWEHIGGAGCEYLSINKNNSSLISEGLVLFTTNEDVHNFSYKVVMDSSWITKSVEISDRETNHTLNLQSDGKGNWYANKSQLPDMFGAIDVDISITPFSNSLPINRFKWREGEERNFQMLYIDIPSLELKKLEQRYKFIGNSTQGRKFQYNCRDYETIITVDKFGIVVDYPDLFIRRF